MYVLNANRLTSLDPTQGRLQDLDPWGQIEMLDTIKWDLLHKYISSNEMSQSGLPQR